MKTRFNEFINEKSQNDEVLTKKDFDEMAEEIKKGLSKHTKGKNKLEVYTTSSLGNTVNISFQLNKDTRVTIYNDRFYFKAIIQPASQFKDDDKLQFDVIVYSSNYKQYAKKIRKKTATKDKIVDYAIDKLSEYIKIANEK